MTTETGLHNFDIYNEPAGAFRACHFFVIGAMKAGTTTLHDDLSCHPGLYLPSLKEPGFYCGPEFGGPALLPARAATRDDYIRIYSRAGNGQLRGDFSTHYTKLPDLPSAAEHILRDSGPDTKIIYLVRDPIKRAISHYSHDFQHGHCDIPTLVQAIEDHPPLINCSRYAMQIEPYLRAFGSENVMVVKFENYIQDRHRYAKMIAGFIGADPDLLREFDKAKVMNSSLGRIRLPEWVRKIRRSSRYHATVRPFINDKIRSRLLAMVSSAPQSVECGAEPGQIENLISEKLSVDDFRVFEQAK